MALTTHTTDNLKVDGSAPFEKAAAAGRGVFKNTMALIRAVTSPACNVEFVNAFLPISKETFRWIWGINSVASIGFSGNSLIEQIQNLHRMAKVDPKRASFHMINIARDASYLALGVIGICFVAAAIPMVPCVTVACLTSGLTFSIAGYFYERLYDPENKGKNLNPSIVI